MKLLLLALAVLASCGRSTDGGAPDPLPESLPESPPSSLPEETTTEPSTTSATAPRVAAGYHRGLDIDVDGLSRTYDLYVPEGFGESPQPLVFLFHGHRGSAASLMGDGVGAAPFSVWFDHADESGVILAIPDGTVGPNGHMGWNDCRSDASGNSDADDVGFVEALLEEIAAAVPVDRDRIFASGISNGGHMSFRLAIERPELVTAIATIAAAMPVNIKCAEPREPVPVLMINGTDDPLVPFDGGPMVAGRGAVLSARASIEVWAQLAANDPEFETTEPADSSDDDSSTVVAHRHSGVTDAWLYEVVGGGHTDPSVSQRYSTLFKRLVGEQNGDIESADEIWAFFERQG